MHIIFLINGNIIEAKHIANLKPVPFSDDNNNPTFEPIQETRNNFKELVNSLARN